MYDRIAVASYHVILSFFATLLTFLVQLSMIDSLRIVRSWWNSKPIKSSGLPLTFPVFLSTYSNRNTCQLSFIFKLRRSLKKIINRNPHPVQFFFIPAEHDHVIHVSDIVCSM